MRKHSKRIKLKPFKYKKLKKDLHWLDAVSETGWVSESDMEAQAPAKAVCSQMWIFKETDKYITLFGTYSYCLLYTSPSPRD